MSKFPVALQLYSVRDDVAKDLEGTLRKVKAMGYDGVEFAGPFDRPASEVKALCDEIGLVPLSAHIAMEILLDDPDDFLAQYKALGCEQMVLPFLSNEYRPGNDKFWEVIGNAKTIGESCKKAGLKFAYHNHDFEFTKIDGEYALDILYSQVPADLMETQLDTCWVNVGGADPVEYIKKYAGRAFTVHLKDFIGQKAAKMYALLGDANNEQKQVSDSEAFCLRPVGYGKQDFPAILQACEEAGVKWLIVEQDDPSMGKTPLECAEMSINYLKIINK